jgi:ADP-ribose pyrophosphatase YjhB (NUDIX family)
MKSDLHHIAEELHGIAARGLRQAVNGYDRERYEKLLENSARLAAALEGGDFEDVAPQYSDNLAHVSPLVCVEAAVFRDEKILLIQRRDDGKWAMPGGLAEVGETLAEAVERELWEEAGVRGRAVQLLGMYDSRFWPTKSGEHLLIAQFLLETDDIPSLHVGVDGAASSFAETLAVGYFPEHELPPLHVGFNRRLPMAFKLWRGEIAGPFFDA